MGSNRTILIAVATILFLTGIYYLATLRPLASPTVLPNQPETASASASIDEADASMANVPPTSPPPQTEEAEQAAETEQAAEQAQPEASDAVADNENGNSNEANTGNSDAALFKGSDVNFYSYRVINSYPHDFNAFTQGLIWHDGVLYEGTGIRGRSSLRKVNLEDGVVTQQIALPENLFGEGITIFNDRIYQLTWQANVGFVYDLQSFEQIKSFNYPTQGWGITHDGRQLIMSDGSTQLFFWDPETLQEIRRVEVTLRDQPVERLNELEYIDGQIYANIWQTNWIAIIDPETGTIGGMINLEGLLQIPAGHTAPVDVLNGIAHDDETGRLFVTGKLWPQLYEIELIEDTNS